MQRYRNKDVLCADGLEFVFTDKSCENGSFVLGHLFCFVVFLHGKFTAAK